MKKKMKLTTGCSTLFQATIDDFIVVMGGLNGKAGNNNTNRV